MPGTDWRRTWRHPAEWRATTVQACGLWPWAVGAGSPTIGTPLGRHLVTGSAVCFDPLAWFTRARLLLNPSAFVLGLPALGKSTLTRRLVIGAAASGTVPMVLGDLKPDYVDTVRALGGRCSPSAGARAHSTRWTPGRWTRPPRSSGGRQDRH